MINLESIFIQVIPWVLTDSNFVRSASQKLDPNRTVFVGGLHGMINAEALCQVTSCCLEVFEVFWVDIIGPTDTEGGSTLQMGSILRFFP